MGGVKAGDGRLDALIASVEDAFSRSSSSERPETLALIRQSGRELGAAAARLGAAAQPSRRRCSSSADSSAKICDRTNTTIDVHAILVSPVPHLGSERAKCAASPQRKAARMRES